MAPTAEDTAVRRQGFAGAARRDARNVGRGFKAGKVGRVSNGQVVTGCAWKSGNAFERDAHGVTGICLLRIARIYGGNIWHWHFMYVNLLTKRRNTMDIDMER